MGCIGDVLDEIWVLIESVSEGLLTYSFNLQIKSLYNIELTISLLSNHNIKICISILQYRSWTQIILIPTYLRILFKNFSHVQ